MSPAVPSTRPGATIALLLALGLALLAVAVGAAVVTLQRNAADADAVEDTLRVEASLNRVAALNEQIETARRGYLIDPNADFTGIALRTTAAFEREQAHLRGLIEDNRSQVQSFARIRALADERTRLLDDLFAAQGPERRLRMLENFDEDRGVAVIREIRRITARMIAEESALLQIRNQRQFRSLVELYVVGGAALLLLLLVLGTVIVLVLRYNRALGDAEASLRQANIGLEAAVAARTAELRRANAEIQRFAYIVSHDLRSPLVNVMGFTAELESARETIHQAVRGDFPANETLRIAVEEDLPEALGFIRTSTQKMDRLISSILEVSRQGRRPLTPEPLDLDALAAGVVATLRQRVEEAGATVTVESLPPIVSDRLSIEQILANLIENALKYLSPARAGEVTVSGEAATGMVHLVVADNGRGIDPKDHERVFDLFRRSGLQDQPGEGIGLAHVRALVYRLGGTISVDSALDRGARFRLSLPATFIATDI